MINNVTLIITENVCTGSLLDFTFYIINWLCITVLGCLLAWYAIKFKHACTDKHFVRWLILSVSDIAVTCVYVYCV